MTTTKLDTDKLSNATAAQWQGLEANWNLLDAWDFALFQMQAEANEQFRSGSVYVFVVRDSNGKPAFCITGLAAECVAKECLKHRRDVPYSVFGTCDEALVAIAGANLRGELYTNFKDVMIFEF